MNIDFLKRLGLFVALLLAQALVLNHIHLFYYATPLLYIYFVVSFRRGYPRWGILLWSFALGLFADALANTPGVATTSLTLLGLLQPYVLELFMQRDDDEAVQPSITTMGMGTYALYSLLLTAVYTIVFFSIETFTFFNWSQWLIAVGASTAITYILLLPLDHLRRV